MTLGYGSGRPPEAVTVTVTDRNGKTRTYRAFQGTGMNWDVVDANGTTHRGGMSCRNKFEAIEGLRQVARNDHLDGLVNRPSPIRDRVVGVDLAGNLSGAEIIPRR